MMGTIETEQWLLMMVLMLSSLLNIAYLIPIPLYAFFPDILINKQANDDTKQITTSENNFSSVQIKEAPLPSLIAIVILPIP